MATQICPGCGSADARAIGRLPDATAYAGAALPTPMEGGTLFRCRSCALKFRSPVPSLHDRLALYDNTTTSSWPAQAPNRPDWKLTASFVERHASPGAQVLDIGCYTGGLLSLLPTSLQRAGIEPNKGAADVASQSLGIPVWRSLQDVPPETRFDLIVATDVIEHVDSPAEFIDAAFALLKPEGVLVVTTGDGDAKLASAFGANWWYWYFCEHIAFISENWLRTFSMKTGTQVLHLQRFSYESLHFWKRASHFLQVVLYGVLGKHYLAFLAQLYRVRGRTWPVYPKGRGVSADHLMVVLKRPPRQPA